MKRNAYRVFEKAILGILTLTLLLFPLSVSFAEETAEVSNAGELAEALGDDSVSTILFKEDIETSESITISKPTDLNGKTWTVGAGTALVAAAIGNGTFQSAGAGEIRYPKEIVLFGAESGETVDSIIAGGKTDSNETYIKGKIVISSNETKSVSVFVLADNVAGSIATARPVTVCRTSGGEYSVKGAEGGLYKNYKIKYVIRFVDKDGKEMQPGIPVINENATEYTLRDSVTLQPLAKLESEKESFEFSGWYDENQNPVSGMVIPAGSSGDRTFYGIYVAGDAMNWRRGGGARFNFGSLLSAMQEESTEKGETTTEQADVPKVSQTEEKRISKASSKTTVVFSDEEQNKLDVHNIAGEKVDQKNQTPMLVIGIAMMVMAVVAGILILTKKR